MGALAKGYLVETAVVKGGFCMKLGSSEELAELAGAGEVGVGISFQTDHNFEIPVGQNVDVVFSGITKVILAATLAAGANIASDAAGKAVALDESAGTKSFRFGVLNQGGVAGDAVDCRLTLDTITTET